MIATRLTVADSEAAARLHKLCFPSPWSADSFRRLLGQATTLGYGYRQSDDRLVALCLCQVVAEEAEILTLCCHPDSRRQGLATALLATVVPAAMAFGARRLSLEVAVDNSAAIGLYAKYGLNEIGRRPAYYSHAGETRDALVLAGVLADSPQDR